MEKRKLNIFITLVVLVGFLVPLLSGCTDKTHERRRKAYKEDIARSKEISRQADERIKELQELDKIFDPVKSEQEMRDLLTSITKTFDDFNKDLEDSLINKDNRLLKVKDVDLNWLQQERCFLFDREDGIRFGCLNEFGLGLLHRLKSWQMGDRFIEYLRQWVENHPGPEHLSDRETVEEFISFGQTLVANESKFFEEFKQLQMEKRAIWEAGPKTQPLTEIEGFRKADFSERWGCLLDEKQEISCIGEPIKALGDYAEIIEWDAQECQLTYGL